MLLESRAAYSTDKAAFQCACGNKKHCRFLGVQRVSRDGSAAFRCRVCSGQGSNHEKLLYELLDNEHLVQQYAVETHGIAQPQQLHVADGSTLNLHLHRWDGMTLTPPSLLIEVHGEQHSSKVDTRANNHDETVAIRSDKDHKLAQAAMGAGFSVLWLHVGNEQGRPGRWASTLREAVRHVTAQGHPVLFIA